MAQQQGPARSVGARGGHEGPGGEPGPHPASASSLYAIRTRCRPPPRGRGRRRSCGRKRARPQELWKTAKSAVSHSPRGCGRRRSRGRKERAHRSLENRKERGFPQRPQPSSSSSSRVHEKTGAGAERTGYCRELVRFRRPLTPCISPSPSKRRARSACATSTGCRGPRNSGASCARPRRRRTESRFGVRHVDRTQRPEKAPAPHAQAAPPPTSTRTIITACPPRDSPSPPRSDHPRHRHHRAVSGSRRAPRCSPGIALSASTCPRLPPPRPLVP